VGEQPAPPRRTRGAARIGQARQPSRFRARASKRAGACRKPGREEAAHRQTRALPRRP